MAKKIKDDNGKVYVEKKPFYKRIWFIVLAIILLMIIVKSLGGNNSPTNEATKKETNGTQTNPTEYTAVDAGQLLTDLDDNALQAERNYKNKNVELTGKVDVIDSSGKYISVVGPNDDFALISITCYLQNDEQRDIVAGIKKGQVVNVKGQVTDVGEVMGYSVKVDEITPK